MKPTLRRYRRLSACASIVILIMLGTREAVAADGRITFDGEVADATCLINGVDKSADLTVKLPKVTTSALAADGDTAGLQSFVLKLSGCKTASGSVYPHFLFGESIDPKTNRLMNQSTGNGNARNVQIAILNEDLSPVDLAKDAGEQNVLKVELNAVTSGEPATTQGEATLKFFAQYVATGGAATAGRVNANVLYAMVYP